MDYFHFVDNQLYCEEVPLTHIAKAVGTPFYCYSEKTLQRHVSVFQEAFSSISHLICYSVKANSNLAVLDALVKQGAGFDIVSVGELERVKRVGCPPERVVYSGVGKGRDEIRAALAFGLLMFNVESRGELLRLNKIAGEMGKKAPVAIRVNPDVDPQTHPYISTGMRANKFGIAHDQALSLYQEAAGMKHLQVVGMDCHIGSQLTSLAPFVDALKRILALEKELRDAGIKLKYMDLGGGLGIPYEEEQTAPHPDHYAGALMAELVGRDITLILEPGRAIAGNAGVLVTAVEYVKEGEDKRFIITDAGMNDLMRPALYQAYHSVLPVVRRFGREESVADVVGPICESGDYFARDRLLPEFQEGELMAIRSAGAYGFVMSSNYNSRPRVPEVMVRGGQFAVVRRRETIAQLMENESLFA
ncbi:MAG: diaminopimelate decarboxylase [Magnetococcales bacterium]|nr:diaminopimelate decarboxylase [Magnetococcales bacterium]